MKRTSLYIGLILVGSYFGDKVRHWALIRIVKDMDLLNFPSRRLAPRAWRPNLSIHGCRIKSNLHSRFMSVIDQRRGAVTHLEYRRGREEARDKRDTHRLRPLLCKSYE